MTFDLTSLHKAVLLPLNCSMTKIQVNVGVVSQCHIWTNWSMCIIVLGHSFEPDPVSYCSSFNYHFVLNQITAIANTKNPNRQTLQYKAPNSYFTLKPYLKQQDQFFFSFGQEVGGRGYAHTKGGSH